MNAQINEEVWTPDQIKSEFAYRVEERLGIMGVTGDPTPEQLCQAMAEADTACEQLGGSQ